MKGFLWTLLTFQTLLLLAISTFTATWTPCAADHEQWSPYSVMTSQMIAFPQVLGASTCGNVTPDHNYVAFNHLEVNGSIPIASDYYTWKTRVPYHYNVTKSQFCLDYMVYLPNGRVQQVNVRFLAIDDANLSVGCIDIVLTKNNETLVSA